MAYSIAKKKSILESVKFAKEFSYEAIKYSQKIGSGVKITSPKKDQIKTELDSAIKEFQGMNNVHLLIPECQTNFVFARQNSKSTSDVIGIAGRIVKTGKSLVVAGELEYGGSRHVASAVLSMQKKFPQIRSALNIRFDERLLKKFQKAKSRISNYDRVREPLKIKLKENSSISWGVQSAIKNSNLPPDIIYHKGDFGKEAMIIIFGKNPKDVVAKISKIL
jgi:hydroxymethylpyrimidine/phosphomethylpyrimidine kinase